MTARPILFSAPMVRALLDGRKTQTRRLAWLDNKKAGANYVEKARPSLWQRVTPGDRLWVREAWRAGYGTGWFREDLGRVQCPRDFDPKTTAIEYLADGANELAGRNRPGIHMPRWASRLTLDVTAVRAQRLGDISNYDARAEGVDELGKVPDAFPVLAYRELWASLHGMDSWDDNPDVVALTFRVTKANIDSLARAA